MQWLAMNSIALLPLVCAGFFVGVILPAVWSSCPARRQAAVEVLTQVLRSMQRRR